MGRLGKWALLMMEFDLAFVPQKSIKGQALAEFLAAHPVPDDSPLITDLPDEEVFAIEPEAPWELYFDGASRTETDPDGAPRRRAGAGLVFKTPQGGVIYHSFSLMKEECSNNEAEYEALIFGLLLALSMEVRSLRALGDSQLIFRQVNNIYEVRKPELVPYYNTARRLMDKFRHIEIAHVPRSRNAPADALAKLASSLVLPDGKPTQVNVEERWLLPAVLELVPADCEVNTITTNVVEEGEWLQPFLDYFQHGRLPDDPTERRQLQRRLPSYVYKAGVLYKRSYGHEMLLRCVGRGEADRILQEVHHGVCGGHQGGVKMYHSIRLAGYYWPGIMVDCLQVAKSCHGCQVHGDFKHQPPAPLHPTIPSWPFDAWGIDVIGPIEPPSSRGHRFILAATDYFSKWAEAVPLREVKSDNVINFLERHIIYRFGIPYRVTSDNDKAFKSGKMYRFMEKYKIKWSYSTGYYPQANGAIEAFNKTLGKILKKTVTRHRRDWDDRLYESLWAYRVTVRTPTQATPYSLVYGSEAVLPLEIQLPSLRVAVHEELTQDEQIRLRYQELDALEEGRLETLQNLELYRQNMVRAYDKLVKRRVFRKGELVLVLRRPIVVTHKTRGKFEPKWEGPYVIEQAYDGGAYQLVDHQGSRPMPPINGRFLKKYFA
jgi:ribonuclease HI